jgi:hypothetical protein
MSSSDVRLSTGDFPMFTVDLSTYDRSAFVVLEAVRSGNAGSGGDSPTHSEGGAHKCPAVESDAESVVHWTHFRARSFENPFLADRNA